jgi:hypothetical protein
LGIGKISDEEEIENPAGDNRVTNFKKKYPWCGGLFREGVFLEKESSWLVFLECGIDAV